MNVAVLTATTIIAVMSRPRLRSAFCCVPNSERNEIKKPYSQEQLAEKLYVTRAMVSKWERGICLPNYNMILKIAEILSVSPDEIMSRNDAVLNELYSFLSDTDSNDLLKDLNDFLSTLKEY